MRLTRKQRRLVKWHQANRRGVLARTGKPREYPPATGGWVADRLRQVAAWQRGEAPEPKRLR